LCIFVVEVRGCRYNCFMFAITLSLHDHDQFVSFKILFVQQNMNNMNLNWPLFGIHSHMFSIWWLMWLFFSSLFDYLAILGPGAEQVEQPRGSLFPQCPPAVVVRRCYEDFMSTIVSKLPGSTTVVSGTPGIGKTSLMFFLINQLLKDQVCGCCHLFCQDIITVSACHHSVHDHGIRACMAMTTVRT
jgi:hypothetical protein